MKWTTYILLILLCTGSITFKELDGGNQGFQIVRNPFQTTTCPTLEVYSPVEGQTYYNNNILLNVSSNGEFCRYKTSGTWNNITCNYNNTRTFENGDVTLTVEATNGGCTKESIINFTVYSQTDYWGYIDYWFMLWIFIGAIILLAKVMYGKKQSV